VAERDRADLSDEEACLWHASVTVATC
jgi:hypothetical protein